MSVAAARTLLARAAPTGCVVLAGAVAGLLFAPVFGLTGLLAPVGVPAGVMLLVALACARRPSLVVWRPLLVAGGGLLAVLWTTLWSTTLAGLPTGATWRALAAGVTDSWRLALQSTWPARPEPELLLFVPLLVVLAGALGVELLHRLRGPLPALAPSLAVALLSQGYAALPPVAGTVAALGYAAVAGALLATTRHGTDPSGTRAGTMTPTRGAATRGSPGGAVPASGFRSRPPAAERSDLASALFRIGLPLLLAVLAALLAGVWPPAGVPRYAAHRDEPAPLPQTRVTSPLDEIAFRLTHPGTPVFRVRAVGNGGRAGTDGTPGPTAQPETDRWPLVVLDTFDGVNWTPGAHYRRMGTELPAGAVVTVPVRPRSAEIETVGAAAVGGPWLPSQTWPAQVRGVEPLVEQEHGSLLLPSSPGPARYTLTWWQPQVDAGRLDTAALDPRAPGGRGGVGVVPPGIAELAEQAVRGGRPSFQTALVLERYLRENYRLATGAELPTGHAWPQLADFLLRTRRGTSEQFAAAYVTLARMVGIPARLTVGFRTPATPDPDGGYTVRNGDVLAWPEVAVAGLGWVPLDPSSSATAAPAGPGLAALTARARAQLPPPEALRDPPVAPNPVAAGDRDDDGSGFAPSLSWLGVPALLLVAWLVGVPAARAVRTLRRRRRPGAAAVAGAWAEVRDRLREHGLGVPPGMTVRELAGAAATVVDQSTVDELRRLGTIVDRALWSGDSPGQGDVTEAWAAVRAVRRGLARRGWRRRLRAGLDPRTVLRRG
ncbi:transglutaminase domain-containing protein [Plantactinospora sonchi]|uniref:Transglutaminase domain-containing protein n=1 Tax=Plantactinospora sonchi TaxID=1544735 RepID=A0ABU7RP21_9ACTN